MSEHNCCPCVARLLAELVRRDDDHHLWQGRDHRQPVPHLALLAGVHDWLFGPRSAEDLC